jgi:hypothetical protein
MSPVIEIVRPVVSVAAEPVVLWFSVGKSAATAIERTPVVVVFLTMPVPSAPRNCAAESPASAVPWTMNLLAKATLAEPSTLLPARLRAVVHLVALRTAFAASAVLSTLPSPTSALTSDRPVLNAATVWAPVRPVTLVGV